MRVVGEIGVLLKGAATERLEAAVGLLDPGAGRLLEKCAGHVAKSCCAVDHNQHQKAIKNTSVWRACRRTRNDVVEIEFTSPATCESGDCVGFNLAKRSGASVGHRYEVR